MGGQGGCERRSKIFVKNHKKNFEVVGRGSGGGGEGVQSGGGHIRLGGQGGCERRSKVLVKNQKKN